MRSYANPHLFHYFLWDSIFDLHPLFQEYNYGVKEGLGVYLFNKKTVHNQILHSWHT
jgi:hypothetical protein